MPVVRNSTIFCSQYSIVPGPTRFCLKLPDPDPTCIFATRHNTNLSVVFRLCTENAIEFACWSHSTTQEKTIIVTGKGITDEKKTLMETETRNANSEFVVEFFNCETLTHHLSSHIESNRDVTAACI